MAMKYEHTPVMLNEVLEYLKTEPGKNYIDCTMGGLGYSVAISRKILPNGKLISIDLDELAFANAEEQIKKSKIKNIIPVHDNFKNIHKIYNESFKEAGREELAGIVFDLGLSTAQLEDRSRGFSFQLDDPLNMSFAHTRINTNLKRIYTNNGTQYIVNKWPEKELARIIFEYGDERHSRSIAKEIVFARKKQEIKSTKELVDIIARAVPGKYRQGKIHFATRTFQALRIATNDELNNLSTALEGSLGILSPRGRIVAVAYHSLEDRIIKRFFKNEARDCICPKETPECRCGHKARLKIITKKIITPSADEIRSNPRARSAKLRVAERL